MGCCVLPETAFSQTLVFITTSGGVFSCLVLALDLKEKIKSKLLCHCLSEPGLGLLMFQSSGECGELSWLRYCQGQNLRAHCSTEVLQDDAGNG